MELYQLEYLIAIYEQKTFLKAAEACHVSQPSITKAIKKLEEEFGFPLFIRNKNRLEFNQEGLIAVERARKIIKEVHFLEKAVLNSHEKNKVISIASNAPAPLWGIKTLLTGKIEEHLLKDNEEILQGFHNHDFSMIILDYPIRNPNIICHKICDEQLHIAVKENHELAKRKGVTFQEIDGYSFLQMSKVGYWNEVHTANLPKSRFLVQEDLENYLILLESSDLPVFRSNISIQKYKNIEKRVYIPITNSDATLSFYVMYHKNEKELFDPFMENIKNIDWSNFNI